MRRYVLLYISLLAAVFAELLHDSDDKVRMGMSYGFGDETVSDVCSRAGISATSFILICNVYLSEGYTPTREVLEQIDLRDILRGDTQDDYRPLLLRLYAGTLQTF